MRTDRMFGFLDGRTMDFRDRHCGCLLPGTPGVEESILPHIHGLHRHLFPRRGNQQSADLLAWTEARCSLRGTPSLSRRMLWSALLIHLELADGLRRISMSSARSPSRAFHRDRKVMIPATIVVAGRSSLPVRYSWPESVYGIVNPEWWRFLEHAFWVVFEDVFLTPDS